MSRPPLEVAEVVRQHGAAFLAHYGPTLSGEQHRALRAIAVCRTAALGGHITQCDHCGHEVQAYNSCRHRCCPKCHGPAQAAWLAARERGVPCRPHFFLPVRVLSRRFRHLYVAGLAQTYAQGQLTFTGRCRALTEPAPWQRLLATLRDQEWVVYAKEPIQDPQHVLQYLA